jgi:hypothetical protein
LRDVIFVRPCTRLRDVILVRRCTRLRGCHVNEMSNSFGTVTFVLVATRRRPTQPPLTRLRMEVRNQQWLTGFGKFFQLENDYRLVTSCCVHLNAAGLFLRGFEVYVVEDCCGLVSSLRKNSYLESLGSDVVRGDVVSNARSLKMRGSVEWEVARGERSFGVTWLAMRGH